MNPIPGYVHENGGGWTCCERWFDPPCDDPVSLHPPQQLSQGLCSGEWLTKVTTYDKLRVPEHLEPGEYVLGFRWDCESSAQGAFRESNSHDPTATHPRVGRLTARPSPAVWQSCADVTITA